MRGGRAAAASAVLLAGAFAAVAVAAEETAGERQAPAVPAAVGGVIYEGSDRATIRLPAALAAVAEEYENAGYRLRRGSPVGEVTIEAELAPLSSRAPFSLPAGGDADEVTRTARSAAAGAATVYEAVSGVLGWLVHHVSDGDPAAVARRAVAMLGAVGVEARTVRGRVVGPRRPGAPGGPHVWIEVRYPDRGWAFSDPLHHHHWVPATYLRLVDDDGRTGVAELVERSDRREVADVYPAGGPGVGARGNGGGQVAAALRVVVPGAGGGAAVLTDAAGSTRRLALLDGEGVFVGLAGGAYTLEVLVPGRPALSRALEIAARERSAVYFTAAAEQTGTAAAPPGSPPATGRQPAPTRRAP